MVHGSRFMVNGFSLKSRGNDRNSRNEPDRQAEGKKGNFPKIPLYSLLQM